jgi:hypothetical protein
MRRPHYHPHPRCLPNLLKLYIVTDMAQQAINPRPLIKFR